MNHSTPFLRIENLSKSYGPVAAVQSFTLTASRDDFVVIVGPSGCGKSTVLRLVAGLTAPSSGTIWLDGQNITALKPARRDIAMVFQDYALYPHLTVAQNIAFPLKLRHAPRAQRRERVEATAQLLGITDILNRRPAQLSGGQQQRVAIGRALVREPRLFLMDEPLSNLDAHLRLTMRTEFRHLAQRLDVPILYVTHDPAEALALATKLVVMEAGGIVQAGTPAEILADPQGTFLPLFLEAAKNNSAPW